MTDLTWNANHIYNLFKCWRYIPDRNIKKSGHGSNLRRGYQRFSDSSWNDNLFHVQSCSSNIFIHNHPYIYIYIHPCSSIFCTSFYTRWHPIQVPCFSHLPMTELLLPTEAQYLVKEFGHSAGSSWYLHRWHQPGEWMPNWDLWRTYYGILWTHMDTTVRLKNNDAFNNTNIKH